MNFLVKKRFSEFIQCKEQKHSQYITGQYFPDPYCCHHIRYGIGKMISIPQYKGTQNIKKIGDCFYPSIALMDKQ